MSVNPYSNLPPTAFWRTGVADQADLINHDIYQNKFLLNKSDNIVTVGSCFAQHIGKSLAANGYSILDYEKPFWSLSQSDRLASGYSMYSARYGNIYTVRQLKQLIFEAFGVESRFNYVWSTGDGKFIDALRPAIFPGGLDSVAEVDFHRKYHLAKVRALFVDADVIIYTLGLTEAWRCKEFGTVYPMAPGVVGGVFSLDLYEFVNFDFNSVKSDLVDLICFLNTISSKPKKFIFTVSPVPLTATASGKHVLLASTYSKSILRAVVGDICSHDPNIDYFPSFEMVMSPWTKKRQFSSNCRTIPQSTVNDVMKVFFNRHGGTAEGSIAPILPEGKFNSEIVSELSSADDIVCEEALIESIISNSK